MALCASSVASIAGLKARNVAPRRAARVVAPRASDVDSATTTETEFPEKPLFGDKNIAYLATMPGVCAPTGVFDPAVLLNGKTPNGIRRFREAELVHGRVAMLGCAGVFAGEKVEGVSGITGPAIYHFEQMPGALQLVLLAALGYLEYGRATTGWVSPADGGYWELKADYSPGELGFDPLGLYPTSEGMQKEIKTKEINNGRLAMIAIAGIIVQELKTGEPIF